MRHYFKLSEFRCQCKECKNLPPGRMHPELLQRLNTARDILGDQIIISSGLRCEKHNKAVSASLTSSHLVGLAADIYCTTSPYRQALILALLKAGFTRIGINNTFVHVDVDSSKTQHVMWVY